MLSLLATALHSCMLLYSPLSLLLPLSTAANDNVTAFITLTNSSSPLIQPNFVSFSLEVSTALGWTGTDPTNPKPTFLALMSYLRLTPHSPGPTLRIGGNSADESWWNPNRTQSRPANISYDIGEVDVLAVDAAVRAMNGSAVYGLNFRRGWNSSWAVAHATAIGRLVGWDRARLEIGNECDLYSGNGIRNSSYSFAQYDSEWTAYAADIANAVSSPSSAIVQGATFASNRWVPNLPGWSKSHVQQLSSVSIHSYPNTHCSNHTVTIDMLLTDAAAQNEAHYIASLQLPAKLDQLGLPLQLGEGNSVSCGGMPGVSNSFASAVWAVDTLFNLAAVGMRGFNFHGGGSSLASYSAFVFANGSTERVTVQPLFYALHVFARATRDYPRIVYTEVQSTTNPAIKLHSTWNGQRATTVIVHKHYNATAPATVTLTYTAPPAPLDSPAATFSFPAALVYRLYATSIQAEFDISLSGATWAGSSDGKLVGQPVPEHVQPVSCSQGVYVVVVQAGSVVLVEWQVDGGGSGLGGGEDGGGTSNGGGPAVCGVSMVRIAALLVGLALLLL